MHIDISRQGTYCIITPSLEDGFDVVAQALAEKHIPLSQNPDYLLYKKTTISVDDVREIIQFHQEKPQGDTKTILCVSSFITTSAQHALLKITEEVKEGERIFLIVPPECELLPTVKSRSQIYVLETIEKESDIQEFIDSSEHVRLAYLEKHILSIEESDEKREKLLSFLRDLEFFLARDGGVVRNADILKALPVLRQMLGNPGAPAKMIAEYVALSF